MNKPRITDIIGSVDVPMDHPAIFGNADPDAFDFAKLDTLVAEGLTKLDDLLTLDADQTMYVDLGIRGRCLVAETMRSLKIIQRMRT